MYVFKIVPFLNPDGVYNGCYRSDTLGHNLNRVYLKPNQQTQPSIYAVRKLIRYYHNSKDVEDSSLNADSSNASQESDSTEESIITNNNDNTTSGSESKSSTSSHEPYEEKSVIDMNVLTEVRNVSLSLPSTSSSSTTSLPLAISPTQIELTETNQNTNQVKSSAILFAAKSYSDNATATIDDQNENNIQSDIDNIKSESNDTNMIYNNNLTNSNNVQDKSNVEDKLASEKIVFSDKFMLELKPIAVATRPDSASSFAMASTSKSNKLKVKKMSLMKQPPHDNLLLSTPIPNCRNSSSSTNSRYSSKGTASFESKRKEEQSHNTNKSNTKNNSNGDKPSSKSIITGNITSRSTFKTPLTSRRSLNSTNIDISEDFDRKNENEQSSMFLYIDLHGHASKKGVFMYGNYLPKVAEAVECMLLPRLMSMNCHHFHFDACVFSERNMYHKYEIENF